MQTPSPSLQGVVEPEYAETQQRDDVADDLLTCAMKCTILEPFSVSIHDDSPQIDLSAYSCWVITRLKQQRRTFQALWEDSEWKKTQAMVESVPNMWKIVALELKTGSTSLIRILDKSVQNGLLSLSCRSTKRELALAWIHALIGYQTMLYSPVVDRRTPPCLMVRNELKLNGQGIMCCEQDFSDCNKNMHQYLFNFGVMLPPPHFDLFLPDKADVEEALPIAQELRPSTFNAGVLHELGHVVVRWTDSVACHLEFNARSRELFLFRHPSFCMAVRSEDGAYASIHGCARAEERSADWATASEISHLTREMLLSYRLLFGLDRSSQRMFAQKLNPWKDVPAEGWDKLLTELCTSKVYEHKDLTPDKDSFDLIEDFPMLQGKMSRLDQYLHACRPRTLKETWRDKRDQPAWLTLWLLMLIGLLGVVLALAQVILQIVQLALQQW